uniref:DUF834 domain-containing protein n=2 Tax=Oryza sativa subsp. japonica TaxID=39947 RepID=Q10I80_ORYSJ|nr:hypothetical protein [Oryza sativa Japonica Group]ABF97110.1 hypothetical protein LOC_Os03g36320 [Oryza sativa Japonica Group]
MAGDKLRRVARYCPRRRRLSGDERRQRRGGRASSWCCDPGGSDGTERRRSRRWRGAAGPGAGGGETWIRIGEVLPEVFGFGEVAAGLGIVLAETKEMAALDEGDQGRRQWRLKRRLATEREGARGDSDSGDCGERER